jgi:pimeloyl-ACP methyl ester carboxylesterase
VSGRVPADEPQVTTSEEEPEPNWNIQSPTLGGKQLWTDELVHGAWRIQKNVMYGHYRLLDATNTRRAWGTWDQCHHQWLDLKRTERIAPLKPKVVLVLHGLGRSRASMQKMVDYLSQHGDYDVLNISYASTRMPLEEDAKSLARVVSHLENVDEVNFVAHSMGNLVIRRFIHDQLIAARGLGIDPRIRRFVMLAPPNNGAALAERFRYDPTFRLLWGTGGQQFTKQWEEVQPRLATPPCEFGIIAGGGADGKGRNPLLEGDDDMVVTVEETRLPGAADFVIVPAAHTFIMDHLQVQEYTLRFLQHGYFISEESRQRLEAEPSKSGDTP